MEFAPSDGYPIWQSIWAIIEGNELKGTYFEGRGCNWKIDWVFLELGSVFFIRYIWI